MTIKKLLSGDFVAAGLDEQLIGIFNQIWPDGMDVTVENVQLGAATGIDIYYLAQLIMPSKSWAAFLAAEQGLIAANDAAIVAKKRTLSATITGMRLSIFGTLATAIEALGGSVTTLSTNPSVVIGWDQNPEVLLQPFRAALTNVQAGVNSHVDGVETQKQVVNGQISTLNNELAVSKIAALVEAINSSPDPGLLPEQPQGVMTATTEDDNSPKPEAPYVPSVSNSQPGPSGHGPGI